MKCDFDANGICIYCHLCDDPWCCDQDMRCDEEVDLSEPSPRA